MRPILPAMLERSLPLQLDFAVFFSNVSFHAVSQQIFCLKCEPLKQNVDRAAICIGHCPVNVSISGEYIAQEQLSSNKSDLKHLSHLVDSFVNVSFNLCKSMHSNYVKKNNLKCNFFCSRVIELSERFYLCGV